VSPFSFWSLAKTRVRVLLGEKAYFRFRKRLWHLTKQLTPPSIRLRRLRSEFRDVRARFKNHIVRTLIRHRALERELALLKYPSLYREGLDVVAEIEQAGETVDGSPGSVSVVITNYNYSRYLLEAVESVLSQTHRDVEVIVVDDASTDESAGVLETLMSRAGGISSTQVLLKHNVGLPAARNLGVSLARGEFVFILDADNRLLPDCLEQHVRTARSTDADAVYARIRMFSPESHVDKFLSDAPFDLRRLSGGNYIDAMALFRQSALREAGLYSTEPALMGVEDWELWLRFATQGRKVEFIPRVLSEYRVHSENMLRTTALDFRDVWAHLHAKYPAIFLAASGSRPGKGWGRD